MMKSAPSQVLPGWGTLTIGGSDLLPVPVRRQRRAPVAYIPVVAAVPAQRLRPGPDEPRVQDLRQKVVRPAEVRQQVLIAALPGVPRDGAADKMEAEALRPPVGIDLHPPAILPLSPGPVLPPHPVIPPVGPLKEAVGPPAPVAVHELPEESQPLHRPALDGQQRLAVQPVAAGLVESQDGEPVQHVGGHQVPPQVRHLPAKRPVAQTMKEAKDFLRKAAK